MHNNEAISYVEIAETLPFTDHTPDARLACLRILLSEWLILQDQLNTSTYNGKLAIIHSAKIEHRISELLGTTTHPVFVAVGTVPLVISSTIPSSSAETTRALIIRAIPVADFLNGEVAS